MYESTWDVPSDAEKGRPLNVKGGRFGRYRYQLQLIQTTYDYGPDGWTAVLVERYPRSGDEPLSHCVVRLVAIASDRTVTELEPLARTIDVHAIDALFSPARSKSAEQTVELSFHYEGYHVDIEADGTVTLLVEPEEEE